MKRLLTLLLFSASLASAQIAVTGVVPPYGYQVVPGATRQIVANITDGGLPCSTNISAYSISGNVITITATQALTAGLTVTLRDFPTSTFLNGTPLTVLPTGLTGSQYTANLTHADVTTKTENGLFTMNADTCMVDWTVTGSTATGTLSDQNNSAVSSISNVVPTVQVNVGLTGGAGSITGAMGSYAVSATATVTATATSVDDGTKSASIVLNVGALPPATLANGTNDVNVAPAYTQAFKGQVMTLKAWAIGCPDESGTWAITTQPAGGDATIANASVRVALVSATVTGRYVYTYTANATDCSGGSGSAIVYVSPNALPAYAVTPQGVPSHECYPDPALTGTDYEVGSGLAYTTIQSTPAANTLAAGSIIRVHNTDLTGLSPSTYHENYQVAVSGTATQPQIVCGVPDSLGNLPIIDGSHATMQSGLSTGACAGFGVICVWGGGYGRSTPYGYWQSGSAGPSYVDIWNLNVKHANPNYVYTPPGGGAEVPYISGASGINLRGGSFIDVASTVSDTTSNGIFSSENSNSAWADITQFVTLENDLLTANGWNADSTEHGLYFQSFFGSAEGLRVVNYLSTAHGSCMKWRGVEGIFLNNYCAAGPYRLWDGVENQDASSYVAFEPYLGATGDTTCTDSHYCDGDTLGWGLAYYQESAQKDFIVGNVFTASNAEYQLHYAEDHDGGMSDRNGTGYFAYNTLDNAAVVFDTGSAAGYFGYLATKIKAANNIFWYPGTFSMAFLRYQYGILQAQTNLMKTGSFSLATPIMGGTYNAHTANGWQNGCDYLCPWTMTLPIDLHQWGLTTPNYLTTATKPYDATTYVPPSGSAAIGAATALTGPVALFPPQMELNVNTGQLTVRTTTTDIGAEQSGSTPPAPPGHVSAVILLLGGS